MGVKLRGEHDFMRFKNRQYIRINGNNFVVTKEDFEEFAAGRVPEQFSSEGNTAEYVGAGVFKVYFKNEEVEAPVETEYKIRDAPRFHTFEECEKHGLLIDDFYRKFDRWRLCAGLHLQNREAETVNKTVDAPDQIISEHEGYEDLARILNMAYEQATSGKGKERHANGRPFNRQPIMEIGRMTGLAYHTGQAMKKIQEAHKLLEIKGKEAAIRELLGAEVYIAAAIKLIEEMEDHEIGCRN